MKAVDATLERLYRRLGWRIVVAYQLFIWSSSVALGGTGIAVLGRITELSLQETLALMALFTLGQVVGGIVATLGVLRGVRPLVAWLESSREPASAESAWRIGLQLPQITMRWNTLVALLLCSPAVIVAASAIAALGLGAVTFVALMVMAGVLIGVGGGLVTIQLAARPLLRDVGRSLVVHPIPPNGVSVRVKLLAIVPTMLILAAVLGMVLGLVPGADLGGALPELFVTIAMIAVFGVPVTLLLAYSTLQPLEDLLQATERLREGDYTTRVPELSADEHGRLARSFNDAVASLQRFAADNERLLTEVRASRARIVAAGDAERRRVERNIHDGAQQQLVALAVKLRLLEERVGDDDELRTAIGEAGERLKAALAELRELARGLHPSVLTTDGLALALDQLASRAPIPVTVSAPAERFPEAIESTAYFVACEALANVAKYARASHAEVSLERGNGRLLLEIADDGIGGAHADAGSGLTGLVDRVAAIDGELTIESAEGIGTRVIAELPLR